ncbi:MAG TPA: hypothetical protein VD998_01315 [Verrucomicrobiae bacterium]|nr:hypothetical protein [Verrucomicrobiae bacterium]
MEPSKYQLRLEEGEKAREQEDYALALKSFDQAIIEGVELDDPILILNALAQKLLVYKHMFQKTTNPVYNLLMLGDAQTGLKIAEEKKVTGQPKAVMLLRSGDYFFWKKDYATAQTLYEEAVLNVDQEKKGEYAEYLSHLGICQALNGNKTGLENLNKALTLASEDNTLRPFHKLVIVSGIHMRLAMANKKFGDTDKAIKEYETATTMAEELASVHKMPMRLKQLEIVAKELGI